MSEEDDVIKFTRAVALGTLRRFINNSNHEELLKALKDNGKFSCHYESPSIKKKWTMTVEEVDTE